TLSLSGSLSPAPAGTVRLNGNGVTLNGGGTLDGRPVVVGAGVTGVTIQNVKVLNTAGTGVLVQTGASVRLLSDTITGHRIGVDVNGATAFIQGTVLSNNTAGGSDGISAPAGLRVRGGARVDAGQ